jgi:hypothetical protein
MPYPKMEPSVLLSSIAPVESICVGKCYPGKASGLLLTALIPSSR